MKNKINKLIWEEVADIYIAKNTNIKNTNILIERIKSYNTSPEFFKKNSLRKISYIIEVGLKSIQIEIELKAYTESLESLELLEG